MYWGPFFKVIKPSPSYVPGPGFFLLSFTSGEYVRILPSDFDGPSLPISVGIEYAPGPGYLFSLPAPP